MRKIDIHSHVPGNLARPNADWGEVENLIEAAERLGIGQLCCSRPVGGGTLVDVEVVRGVNDSVLAAMRRYPQRISGFCFVQPGNGEAALQEMDRCLDAGMLGVKLYNQYQFSNPVVFPIAEKCIQRGVPFLGHSAHLTDPRSLASQPNTSDSEDYCELSRRYPELMLVMGHINGGGDWEWAIKGLRNCPNVLIDTSGSVLNDRTLEMAVAELGHERVLFATDMTMEGGVGKVLSAELTESQREDIFWRNASRILKGARS